MDIQRTETHSDYSKKKGGQQLGFPLSFEVLGTLIAEASRRFRTYNLTFHEVLCLGQYRIRHDEVVDEPEESTSKNGIGIGGAVNTE